MQTLRDRKGVKTIKLTKRETEAIQFVRDLASDIAAATGCEKLKESAGFLVLNADYVLESLKPKDKESEQQTLNLGGDVKDAA
jgi:hypothetical protein